MPILLCRRAVLRAAFAVAIGSALLAWGGAPAGAATAALAPAKSLVVLVVDTQKVVQESKAGQAVRAQMQERMARYQKGISKQDEEFKTAQAELSRQRSILAQDAFAAKVKEFEGRVGEARQKAQEELKSLSDGERTAYNKIELAMLQVVADIAKERHAN